MANDDDPAGPGPGALPDLGRLSALADLGSLGAMPDLQALLQQASAMQERLEAAQHELEVQSVEGTAAGGLVHATVSGTGELIGLTINPSVCDPDDPETLADLVVAAVHNAVDTAHRRAADTMGALTGDFGAKPASTAELDADSASSDDDVELW